MPARKTGRRTAFLPNRKVLQPGVTLHEGLYHQERDSSSSVQFREDGSGKSLRRRTVQPLPNHEEGVLYTVKVAQRCPRVGDEPPPQSADGEPNPTEPQQYTISKMHKRNNNWFARIFRSFGIELGGLEDVDSHLYKPSSLLAGYLNWTFYASFSAVFISFLGIFIVQCLLFAGLLALAGEVQPDCIVVSGADYGYSQSTKFGDVFALSWTTFTTVGYGNTYPATGQDLEIAKTSHCAGVVFLCTLEAFVGLLYAGMCAAILFGKVNRVQSHAHLTFANVVCLQYEDVDLNQFVDDDSSDSDCDDCDDTLKELKEVKEEEEGNEEEEEHKEERTPDTLKELKEDKDDEEGNEEEEEHKEERTPGKKKNKLSFSLVERVVMSEKMRQETFREQFRGCPILKFQVVNDLCNKAGGEIVDSIMKVVGIKLKRCNGRVTHSQYVRVNLVDFEHPFFGRVWHGVHILDGTSPLLKYTAKQQINENGGRWPEKWFERPSSIRRKLDFHRLVVTVSGVSNVSASTVHAYKRYKFEDVIIGFDFAPLVYEDEGSGNIEVDLELVNDVSEQQKGKGENLICGTTPVDDGSEHSNGNFSRGTSSIFKRRSYEEENNTLPSVGWLSA